MVLKGHHYVRASLYNLHVPSGFLDLIEQKLCLSSGCAGSYHLARKWGWRWRGYGLSQVVRRVFHSAQGLSPPYWGRGRIPSCWSRSPEVWVWANSVPFKFVLSPLPAPAPLTQRGATLKPVQALGPWQCMGWCGLATDRGPGCLQYASSLSSRNGSPFSSEALLQGQCDLLVCIRVRAVAVQVPSEIGTSHNVLPV